MPRNVTGPFASTGREVYIAEAVRTPVGKSHPERGWYRDIHPNAMLAACYTELITRHRNPARRGRRPRDRLHRPVRRTIAQHCSQRLAAGGLSA